ncbi:DinB family protein [Nocardia sp. CDC159]|uniref:DinB family protein n=1 Tax=Nocardia pulmonis TaxID=2951408 RepID=A0A9X2J108_9NOCA|nr:MULTISPECIES: DinB family protein [Nocardia]MCM6777610.1 DinB family protein [Nocardia pulmonis]MCM6790586.1 DinB family protein [Nocardia sp. CDC159]
MAIGHADEYADLLGAEPAALRRRTRPEVWSPLEYACHMRDVLLVQRERLLAARRSERPVVGHMGRDERVEHDGYAQQHPDDVARQLRDAALLFGGALDRLAPGDWERTLYFPFPDPADPTERSLRWLAVHTLHELRHHLLDIRRQLD